MEKLFMGKKQNFKQVMHIISMLLEMKVNVKITSKPFINLVTKEEHKQIYHKQP